MAIMLIFLRHSHSFSIQHTIRFRFVFFREFLLPCIGSRVVVFSYPCTLAFISFAHPDQFAIISPCLLSQNVCDHRILSHLFSTKRMKNQDGRWVHYYGGP